MAAERRCAWLDEDLAEEYCFRRLQDEEKKRVDDHLHFCPACRSRMELIRGQVINIRLSLSLYELLWPAESRRHPRQTAAGQVQMAFQTRSIKLLARAELRDRSQCGLGVLASYPFRVGDKIEVRDGNAKWHAIVRHCRRQNSAYLVGLELVAA